MTIQPELGVRSTLGHLVLISFLHVVTHATSRSLFGFTPHRACSSPVPRSTCRDCVYFTVFVLPPRLSWPRSLCCVCSGRWNPVRSAQADLPPPGEIIINVVSIHGLAKVQCETWKGLRGSGGRIKFTGGNEKKPHPASSVCFCPCTASRFSGKWDIRQRPFCFLLIRNWQSGVAIIYSAVLPFRIFIHFLSVT